MRERDTDVFAYGHYSVLSLFQFEEPKRSLFASPSVFKLTLRLDIFTDQYRAGFLDVGEEFPFMRSNSNLQIYVCVRLWVGVCVCVHECAYVWYLFQFFSIQRPKICRCVSVSLETHDLTLLPFYPGMSALIT